MAVLHEEGGRFGGVHHGRQVLDLEERKDLHDLFAVVFSSIPTHFLVSGSAVLQELVILVETVHEQDKEEFSLVPLLEGLFLEGVNVHGECHLDDCFLLCGLFLVLIVVAQHVAVVVVGHVGEPHVISIGVHVEIGLGVIHEALVEVLGVHLLVD
jgi:hypothetical protein